MKDETLINQAREWSAWIREGNSPSGLSLWEDQARDIGRLLSRLANRLSKGVQKCGHEGGPGYCYICANPED